MKLIFLKKMSHNVRWYILFFLFHYPTISLYSCKEETILIQIFLDLTDIKKSDCNPLEQLETAIQLCAQIQEYHQQNKNVQGDRYQKIHNILTLIHEEIKRGTKNFNKQIFDILCEELYVLPPTPELEERLKRLKSIVYQAHLKKKFTPNKK